MDLIGRRAAEYEPLIEEFLKEVNGINLEGITGIHLPGVGECYEQAKYKFAFCGMETYGWTLLPEYYNMEVKKILTWSDQDLNDNTFLSWPSNYHATFWGFVLKFLSTFYHVEFQKLIGNEFPEILHSFIWANSNAIERFEVTSKCQGAEYSSWEKVKVASRKFDDLNHIINSCRPKVVFICNKNVQKEYFLSDNNLSHIFGLDVSDKSNFLI